MGEEVEKRARLLVWIVERLGFCALSVLLLWVLLGRVDTLQHTAETIRAGQRHLDSVMAPQVAILRTICRGQARSNNWPLELARDCDIATPAPMPPDPQRERWILGSQERKVGG